jgi:mutator protein MutT
MKTRNLKTRDLLRQYIVEVLAGFGNAGSVGRDGIGGDLYSVGAADGSAGVRPTAHDDVLDDEATDDAEQTQDSQQAACCLIRGEDGTILSVSRKDDPTMQGMPGGHVDPGETAEEAAARELMEEVGLTATKLSLIFKRKDANGFTVSTFACEAEGEIKPRKGEHGVVRWVQPAVLVDPAHCPFVDYNRALFKKLGINT